MLYGMNDYYSTGPDECGFSCDQCNALLDSEEGAGKIETRSETLTVCQECLENKREGRDERFSTNVGHEDVARREMQ
jgi:hypothetical protein